MQKVELAANTLFNNGVKEVLVKLGSKGSMLISGINLSYVIKYNKLERKRCGKTNSQIGKSSDWYNW